MSTFRMSVARHVSLAIADDLGGRFPAADREEIFNDALAACFLAHDEGHATEEAMKKEAYKVVQREYKRQGRRAVKNRGFDADDGLDAVNSRAYENWREEQRRGDWLDNALEKLGEEAHQVFRLLRDGHSRKEVQAMLVMGDRDYYRRVGEIREAFGIDGGEELEEMLAA